MIIYHDLLEHATNLNNNEKRDTLEQALQVCIYDNSYHHHENHQQQLTLAWQAMMQDCQHQEQHRLKHFFQEIPSKDASYKL